MPGTSILVVDGDRAHAAFEVLSLEGDLARVKSPLLFEVGEELTLRIEQDGATRTATGRVRAHVGPETELVLL